MIHDEVQDIAMTNQQDGNTPLKQWRSQFESKLLLIKDVVQFLEQMSAGFYTTVQKEPGKIRTHAQQQTRLCTNILFFSYVRVR